MAQPTQTQQQLYTHAAEPKAVSQRRPKVRAHEAEPAAAAASISCRSNETYGDSAMAHTLL